jgi:hypothetical protein
MIRSFIKSLFQPAPRVLREVSPAVAVEEVPALTIEDVILSLRQDGLSYRAIQAQTGATYHRVRKVCLSA